MSDDVLSSNSQSLMIVYFILSTHSRSRTDCGLGPAGVSWAGHRPVPMTRWRATTPPAARLLRNGLVGCAQ